MKKLFSIMLVLALLCSAVCSAAVSTTAKINAQKVVDLMNATGEAASGEFIVLDTIVLEEDDSIYYAPSKGRGGALCQVICGSEGVLSVRFVSTDKETSFMGTTMLMFLAAMYCGLDIDDAVQWLDAGYKTVDSKVKAEGDSEMLFYDLSDGQLVLYGNFRDGQTAYICSLECDNELIPN